MPKFSQPTQLVFEIPNMGDLIHEHVTTAIVKKSNSFKILPNVIEILNTKTNLSYSRVIFSICKIINII